MVVKGTGHIWVFPKIGGKPPQNGWFIMKNPIKIDDLGVFPYFWFNIHTDYQGQIDYSATIDRQETSSGLSGLGCSHELLKQYKVNKRIIRDLQTYTPLNKRLEPKNCCFGLMFLLFLWGVFSGSSRLFSGVIPQT